MYPDFAYGSAVPVPTPTPAQAPAPVSYQDLQGAGGLRYQVDSPPGVGRQVLIPFELGPAPLPAGGNAAGTRFLPILNASAQAANTITMVTATIPWAVVRIVGLVTSTTRQGAVTDLIEVQQLNIGGGSNLLLSTSGQRIDAFDIANEHLGGLRDYPLLRSPNAAYLQISFRDGTAAAGGAVLGNNLVTACLVVEVLADDNFGAHIPGAYARGGAMVRHQIGRR